MSATLRTNPSYWSATDNILSGVFNLSEKSGIMDAICKKVFFMADKQGLIFIIAAASGTGKTTLVHSLLATNPNIKLSISHTTRPPREGETDGQHYFFTTAQAFEQQIANGEFLEYARVYQRYYGTSLAWIQNTLQQGYDILLEIDVQGAALVKEKLPQAISVFILPPDFDTLKHRLTGRQTDDEESIRLRLTEAEAEITQAQSFDYIIVNDHLNTALTDLNSIVRTEHLKSSRQLSFLQNLLAKA